MMERGNVGKRKVMGRRKGCRGGTDELGRRNEKERKGGKGREERYSNNEGM